MRNIITRRDPSSPPPLFPSPLVKPSFSWHSPNDTAASLAPFSACPFDEKLKSLDLRKTGCLPATEPSADGIPNPISGVPTRAGSCDCTSFFESFAFKPLRFSYANWAASLDSASVIPLPRNEERKAPWATIATTQEETEKSSGFDRRAGYPSSFKSRSWILRQV
jgi:hypothetical protein